jgi:hypothetical protein
MSLTIIIKNPVATTYKLVEIVNIAALLDVKQESIN